MHFLIQDGYLETKETLTKGDIFQYKFRVTDPLWEGGATPKNLARKKGLNDTPFENKTQLKRHFDKCL